MIPLKVTLDGDGAFSDLVGRSDVMDGMATEITLLERGMASGKPSIAIRVDTGSGVVVAQTSWALLYSACRAFEARYGAPQ